MLTPVSVLRKDTATWKRTVLADILDKRARGHLSAFYNKPEITRQRISNDPLLHADHVREQMNASPDIFAAKKLYETILLQQCNRNIYFGEQLGYFWAAHRYAGVLEWMGDLQLAEVWFREAYEGRRALKLKEDDKRTERSREGLERVKKKIDVRKMEEEAKARFGLLRYALVIIVVVFIFALLYIGFL